MVGSSVSTKMIDRQAKVACLVERATSVDGIGHRMYEPTLSLREHREDGNRTGANLRGSGVYCQEYASPQNYGYRTGGLSRRSTVTPKGVAVTRTSVREYLS